MINRVRWASVAASLDMRSGIATLADAATAELRERILSGELESGAPLRLEELARSLGTSISPVREAVRKLESLGLAVHVAHRGSRVKELDVDDLRDTYEARLALEPVTVARAAQHITPADVERAQAALESYTACRERGDRPAARDAHDAFHFTLYNASGSDWLVRLIRPTWDNSERYRAEPGHRPRASARARAYPGRVRRGRRSGRGGGAAAPPHGDGQPRGRAARLAGDLPGALNYLL
jgi:DNA-binding GntR family transcriptional regulator